MASFFIYFRNIPQNRVNQNNSDVKLMKAQISQITQNHGGYATMRITTNGTTISGSLSEVLATLTHLGVTAKPVTTAEVTETAVTGETGEAGDGYVVALAPKGSYLPISYGEMESQLATIHAGETVMPEPEATPVPVPKPARDSVIKMAIADVEALLGRNHDDGFVGESLWFVSEGGLYTVTDEVLFTVNADKRTVIAVIRHNGGRHKVLSNGRAKCAPGDVFNEHIGKAIALRRALGLEVPVEYTEVADRSRDDLAVGDVVRGDQEGFYDYVTQITKLIENPDVDEASGQAFEHTVGGANGWLASSQVTLINDSARNTAPDIEVSRIIRH